MPKKRFIEERMSFALRQAESGTLVPEICRKLGIFGTNLYRWKKQFAGMVCRRSGGSSRSMTTTGS